MLEKPVLHDDKIIACLKDEYGLDIDQVVFLPLGADVNTAVYRLDACDQTLYFLKLRRGVFDETSVALPKFLSEQGISQIIAPLAAKTGQLWGSLDDYKVILYRYIEGRNGYQVAMSDHHWRDFGTALKKIHTSRVPPAIKSRIRQETFTATWREEVKMFLARITTDRFDDPVAVKLVAFLEAKRPDILDLVERADRLAHDLQTRPLDFVLCHSDLHAGNILIDGHGAFYIVDWDDPILAPKERDLMFAGGAQGFSGHTPQEEEALFYQGYGQTQVDQAALAYYRYERIVQDIAAFSQQLLSTSEGGEDREQSLRFLKSNFLPDNTIETAYKSDKH